MSTAADRYLGTETLRRHAKNEPNATHVVNQGGLARSIHLVAEAAHMHVDKIGGGNEFVIPDLLEQHGPGQQLFTAAHHVFQEAKLAREQIDCARSGQVRAAPPAT